MSAPGTNLASRLKERVTIQGPSRSADTYGGTDVTWTEVASVFADVQPLLGIARKRLSGDEVTGIAGYRVTIRHRDDVNASMRLLWRSSRLVIHSLHETAATLEILAYEEMA